MLPQSPERLLNGKSLDDTKSLMAHLKIATDFSFVPAGRYYADGPFTGQKFREELLKPLLSNNERVSIDIDGAAGYGSSFLEEAFGGLVREGYYTSSDLRKQLIIVANEPQSKAYELAIWKYIDNARRG
jgi:hypothetical protein